MTTEAITLAVIIIWLVGAVITILVISVELYDELHDFTMPERAAMAMLWPIVLVYIAVAGTLRLLDRVKREGAGEE